MILVNGVTPLLDPFPNGETHLTGKFMNNPLDKNGQVRIDFKYESDKDLIGLYFIRKHILSTSPNLETVLHIWYMPYSRMDRVESEKDIFTLKYTCELINGLNFKTVYVYEPHSDVTTALLNNAKKCNLSRDVALKAMINMGFDMDKDVLLFPDAGAQKRYGKQFDGFKTAVQFKTRNFNTGKITKTQILGEIPKDSKVLIVDDLCSFGGTFLAAANEVKKYTNDIYLSVAHCETSILQGELLRPGSPIKKVFTTDSLIDRRFTSNCLQIYEFLKM